LVADLAIKVQYEKSGLKRLSKSARFISKLEQLTLRGQLFGALNWI
jgi:hypothetical protein